MLASASQDGLVRTLLTTACAANSEINLAAEDNASGTIMETMSITIQDLSTRLHSSPKSSAIHTQDLTLPTMLAGMTAQLMLPERTAQALVPSLSELT